MKKLLVFGFIISLFSTVSFAQDYITSKQLLVDTSKLENFSFYLEQNREMRKNRTVFNPSDDEVKSWYYKGESITSPSEIDYYRDFNKCKFVSYPIKNIDIFNKVLNGAEMLFEYTYSANTNVYVHALNAKYNGKYYTVFYFNQLLEKLDLNEQISVEEKIECIINWKYWLWDQNIELLDIEKTKEQMPYDTIMHHRISLDTEERIAVNVHNDYKAEYFGHILFEGRELEFYANIVGDKKFIKAIFLFEPGTK
ncbi:MAG: hypothetical protein PHW83_11665, partial [Bacteroidales bacterium]|nr:hypothetical protein [Bacteroidales bacterium]